MICYWGLTLLSVAVIGVYSDSHTLRYYRTAVSSPGSGMPEYSEAAYVDDREIANYDSDTRRYLPKTEWMKKLEADYWERETELGRSTEAVSKHDLQTVMNRFNHTTGIHYYQEMNGCELRDDGSTAGYDQYGYDGAEFMSLDTQSWLWIPSMNEAQITTQRWNSPEVRAGERTKNYLQNECIEWLKKHINNGRDELEKTVRPEVKVWGRRLSDGATRLQCLVYGFHPRIVDVSWMKNGVDYVPSDEMTLILPHPDGTYQTRASVEVPTTEEDCYSCHVKHSSLGEETFIVKWDGAAHPDRVPVEKPKQPPCHLVKSDVDDATDPDRVPVEKPEQPPLLLARLDAALQDLSYTQIRRIIIWTRLRISALEKKCEVQPSPEEPAWFQFI